MGTARPPKDPFKLLSHETLLRLHMYAALKGGQWKRYLRQEWADKATRRPELEEARAKLGPDGLRRLTAEKLAEYFLQACLEDNQPLLPRRRVT